LDDKNKFEEGIKFQENYEKYLKNLEKEKMKIRKNKNMLYYDYKSILWKKKIY
jgi:hypothetical protein